MRFLEIYLYVEDAPYLIAIETDRAAPPPRRDYKGHKGHKEQGRGRGPDDTKARLWRY